jgi:hydrogenase expression/formation protein HypD
MRYLDEYRDPVLARRLLDELHATATRPWAIMEVCGGQTNTLVRQGIDKLLPTGMRMIHGPGCPVCVTPLEMVDKAVRIAARPDVIAAMRARPEGASARVIGRVVDGHSGLVTVRTLVGATRIVDMLVGEQLPRIC